MDTKSELRELNDEEMNAIQGGMSCAAGKHLDMVSLQVRSETDWVALARSYLGL
jgi:bacteriocin-like protein